MYQHNNDLLPKQAVQALTTRNINFKSSRIMCLVLSFTLLSACGASDSNDQTSSESTSQDSAAALAQAKSMTEDLSLNLDTTSLNKAAYLGLVDVPVAQVAPCPFLSDESVMALIASKFELKLRDSSNDQCMWSKNMGFSVKLTIEPLAAAKPISERAYNMDSPPVLKPQGAPGNNATVLYDTTWDKELAYAMSFEQSDKLVMLYVTGMNTDASLLTTAAEEVASKLSNTVAETSFLNSAGTYDLCQTWSDAQMAEIMDSSIQNTSSKQACQWEAGSGDALKQIKVGIFYGKDHPWESLLEYRGSKDISGIGERSLLMKNRKKAEGWPANVTVSSLYNELLVSVSVSDSIDNNEVVALALARNIDERFE